MNSNNIKKNINKINIKNKDRPEPIRVDASSPLVNGVLSDEDCQNERVRVSHGEDDMNHHMDSMADDIVAKLVEEDEPTLHKPVPRQNLHPPVSSQPSTPIIDSSPQEDQWFYTDPQVSNIYLL